jgi:hypothetical protein
MSQSYENPADNSGKLCRDVPIAMTDIFELDDSGFWDTHSSWGFAATMLSVRTRGFVNTYDLWRGGNSAKLYSVYRGWNSELQVCDLKATRPHARALNTYFFVVDRLISSPPFCSSCRNLGRAKH